MGICEICRDSGAQPKLQLGMCDMWDFSEKGEMDWEYVIYVEIQGHRQSSSLGHVRYAEI